MEEEAWLYLGSELLVHLDREKLLFPAIISGLGFFYT
jgi:hypothetical protein